jgi:hypothetical protein
MLYALVFIKAVRQDAFHVRLVPSRRRIRSGIYTECGKITQNASSQNSVQTAAMEIPEAMHPVSSDGDSIPPTKTARRDFSPRRDAHDHALVCEDTCSCMRTTPTSLQESTSSSTANIRKDQKYSLTKVLWMSCTNRAAQAQALR